MSEAEELLNSVSSGDATAYTADAGIEEHIIIDKDRVINVPKPLQRIAVQFDHNIETVTFDCPRYWDDNDLSKMYIYINYLRTDKVKGRYLAKNVRVSDTDENLINFEWTIGNEVSFVKGKIIFLVCALQTNSDGIEEIHWNSELNEQMTVSEGLECDDYVMDEYPDIINDLLYRMDSILAANTTILDTSLTQANLAADAKATGEAVNKVDNRVTEIIEGSEYKEVEGNPIHLKNATKYNCDLSIIGTIEQKIIKAEDGISAVGENNINVSNIDVNKESSIFIGANTTQETREGYNKFPLTEAYTYTSNDVTISSDGKGGYRIVTTSPVATTSYYTFQLKEPYTIQEGDYLHCLNTGLSDYVSIVLIDTDKQVMFTTPGVANRVEDLTKYVGKTFNRFRLQINQNNTCDISVSPMIINGNDPKPYELPGIMPSIDYPSEIKSVKGSYEFIINDTQTINADLPEGIELNKLGDNSDKIEFAYTMDETGYKTIDKNSVKYIKNTQDYIYTGDESWVKSSYSDDEYLCCYSDVRPIPLADSFNVYCNYFSLGSYVDVSTKECIANISNTINLKIKADKLDENSVNGLKALLKELYDAETPMKIKYVLATPITTFITDETFISQLEALINIEPNNDTINIVITSENEETCLPLTEFLYNYVTVSPSTIRKSDIKCAGSSEIIHTNKNIFTTEFEYGDISDVNGNPSNNNKLVRTKDYIRVYPNITYSISRNKAENYNKYRFYDKEFNYLGNQLNLNIESNVRENRLYAGITEMNMVILDENIAYMKIVENITDISIKYQIEISDFVSDYSDPINETISLTLPEGISLYKNETIYKEEDKWYKDVKYKKIIIDQNSGVTLYNENFQRFKITVSDFNAPEETIAAEIYCNRLMTFSKNTMHLYNDTISGIDKGGSSLLFRINDDYTTIEKMNEYLTENPLEIVYKLTNPTKEEITDSTLIEQLEKIEKLQTYKGVNNFFLTSDGTDGSMRLKYKMFNIVGYDDLEEVKSDVEEVKTDVNDIMLNMKKEIFESVFPIGSTYVTQTDINPSTILGIGVWERLKGKVLVGLDESDTNFNSIGKTGGESKHTLTVNEIPSHAHKINMGNTSMTIGEIGSGGANSLISRYNYDENYQYDYTNGGGTNAIGGGNAHNNLQPYEVVGYMWIRRA